jgi:hypothetical protein
MTFLGQILVFGVSDAFQASPDTSEVLDNSEASRDDAG